MTWPTGRVASNDEAAGQIVEVTRVIIETVEVQSEDTPPTEELVVCMGQEPDTLYPYGSSMLAVRAVRHAIFENDITSVSFDYQAQGIEKIPSLAFGDAILDAVEVFAGERVVDADGNLATLAAGVTVINADGEEVEFDGASVRMQQLSVDFVMKPRVWSDGTPVTADDSVYSFELAADPNTPTPKFTIDRTAGYEATGELSTRWIGLPGFMDATYFVNFWQPLPRHAWGQFTALQLLEVEASNQMPIGDGPFRIVEWTPGDRIRVVRNEHYYRADEGLPYLDSIVYRFITDTNQLLAQLLSGQCDIGTQDGVDVGQATFLIEAESQGLLTPYFQIGTVYEHINFGIVPAEDYAQTRPDWFGDARVRQAITMCTDRQSMVDDILFGRSEVMHTYIPRIHPLYPETGLTEYPYDVDAANALLDEAGYIDTDGDGIRNDPETDAPFSVWLGTTTGNDMRQQLTRMFRENMQACGIEVELRYLPASEWFADGPDGPVFGRRFDLAEFAWLTGVQPPCKLYLSSEVPGPENNWSGQHNTGWVNEAFDAACTKALSSLPGTPEYIENHMEAQRIFSREVPIIPLFLRLKVAAARPEVLNFAPDATQNSELYNIFEIDLQQ